MGLLYTAVMDAIAVTAITDLFFIAAPADAIVRLHEVRVSQDAQETSEQLPLKIFRTATDNSAVGTGVTGNPLEVGNPAHGSVVRRSITGASLATETTLLWKDAQNLVNGWHYLPTPETQIVLSPSGRLVVKLSVAPGASINVSATITFEEIGG
jgi:hypothetical protein